MTATLLTRVDGSDWMMDMHTQVNFKVGHTPVRRMKELPHSHPERHKD